MRPCIDLTEVDLFEDLRTKLEEFGAELDPSVRPKLLAFLHLLTNPRSVTAHIEVAQSGEVMLLLRAEGGSEDHRLHS